MNPPIAGALAVIPARFGSARLPGKALEEIGGVPMVARVVERARRARAVGRVVVATDDPRIVEAVARRGGEAMMTDPGHPTGTDRVAEVALRLGLAPGDPVVNVQGDEPLVDPDAIDAVVGGLDLSGVDVATGAAPFPGDADPADPARVKVVTGESGRAIYFSRCPIPTGGPWLLHVGLYAFRASALRWFASVPPAPSERAERLEQLRFLHGGLSIRVVPLLEASPSVDTPSDLARVRRLIGG